MNICIQNTVIMREDIRDWDNANLSIRLKEGEARRYWNVMDTAKKRNPYVNKTDVFRELIGLSKPHVLTIAEIIYFRSGKKEDGNITTIPPKQTDIQDQPGLHRSSGKNKTKGTKQAEEIIKDIDVDNQGYDYGEFPDPDKDYRK